MIETSRLRFEWILEIVKRTETVKFKVLPKRWIVERIFAWISFQRRMSKDYERLTETSVAFVQLSMTRVMLIFWQGGIPDACYQSHHSGIEIRMTLSACVLPEDYQSCM
ncbi:MAG: transposase [Bacteroidales bacterium]